MSLFPEETQLAQSRRRFRPKEDSTSYRRKVIEGMIKDGVDPLDAHHIAQWEMKYGPSEERIAYAKKILKEPHKPINHINFPGYYETSDSPHARAFKVVEEGKRFARFRRAMRE